MSPTEYQAKRDWLRSNPTGMLAKSVMRELRAWERELAEQGTTVEAWMATDRVRLGLTPWFVVYFHDRPGQPLGSRVRHRDRSCTGIGRSRMKMCARRPKPRSKTCRRARGADEPRLGLPASRFASRQGNCPARSLQKSSVWSFE